MKNTNTNNSTGTNIFGILTIVFIVLKLTGVINWSWVWVLAPSWISILFFSLAFIACKVLKKVLD